MLRWRVLQGNGPRGQLLGRRAKCMTATCVIGERVTWRVACVVRGRASVQARTPSARTKWGPPCSGPPPASRYVGEPPWRNGGALAFSLRPCVLHPRTHRDRCLGAAASLAAGVWGRDVQAGVSADYRCPRATRAQSEEAQAWERTHMPPCVSPGSPAASQTRDQARGRPHLPGAGGQACRSAAVFPPGQPPGLPAVPYPSSEPQPRLYDLSSLRQ